MTEPTPLARRHATELEQLERTIRSTPMPEQVDRDIRKPRIDELGRMSAEAVLAQYEATAQEVEKMGDTVKDSVKKLGQALIECDNDMKVVMETASAIRDKGKHNEALIARISDMSKVIREACSAFKKQMEG
jgi:uncharacterized coiled-coil DUF342 family protein